MNPSPAVTWLDVAEAYAERFCREHRVPPPARPSIERWLESASRKSTSWFLDELEEWLRSRAVMRNAQ